MIGWLLISASFCYGNIIDFDRADPYERVFVETDDFDTTYLTVLEDAFYQAREDTLRLTLIHDLAYYWHTRNLNKALRFTEEGLALAAELNNRLWEGRLQIVQGAVLLRAEKLDSALIVLREAREKVLEEDLPFLYTQMTYIYERRGLLGEAAGYARQALRIGEALNDQKAIAQAYSDLSCLFWKRKKFEQALEYSLKAEAIFKKRGIEDLDYDFTLYLTGNNYLELKDYDKALGYYLRAIKMGEKYGFYNNLSDVYISLIDLYTYLGFYEKAEEVSPQAIRYATLLDNAFLLMRSWLSVGKLQNLMGQPAAAIQSLQTSLQVATDEFGDNFFLQQVHQELAKAHAATGDYESAYAAMITYDEYKDLVYTREADERIAGLQTELKVAEKENTIRQQQGQLALQRTRQQLILVTLGLLLLILGILYRNYTANRKKNRLLQRQNEEKAFLLKEIHHRVKNNLEVISGLLTLQSARIEDPKVQGAMQASQQRVQSMSLIHRKLYLGENLATVEMKDYFLQLSESILDAFGADDRVTIECDMEQLELDVDTAVPIGLIVNELLTNALKYAFPDERPGKITIALKETEAQTLQLLVADNGVGMRPDSAPRGTGFGTQLIQLLTRQLDGKIYQEVREGTIISLQLVKSKSA